MCTQDTKPTVISLFGFPFEATEKEVITFMKDIPVAEVRMSKRKGSCTVALENPEDFEKALKLDFEYMGERFVRVKPLRDPGPAEKSVYCGNLNYDAREEDLRNFFSDCGEIKDIRWGRNRATQTFKGFCFVEFEDESSVSKALEKNGVELLGRNVRVDSDSRN